ncbi:YceI family protein [Bacteriovorax sp. PP10]|uniref:YceI family protein n=1 Tax=Bacteriovorax antarcticus TaxID=3088717 RepID=A0ABU5VV35_9BACT|nr:YceI family protein [Bacteriovorax sp. PP10]MEA9356902.1 YceI family protein [Bacteriovorax sp. PP10]
MKSLLVIGASFLMMASLSAHEVTVKVTLTPAGNFEAKSAKVKGDVKKSGAGFTAENLWVKTEELKTGIDLRDEHFHKHLNAAQFPKISFTQITAADGKGTGTLNVNGEKKPVSFTYKPAGPGKIEASFTVKASDFKLKEASYMSIGVKDTVDVVAIIEV